MKLNETQFHVLRKWIEATACACASPSPATIEAAEKAVSQARLVFLQEPATSSGSQS